MNGGGNIKRSGKRNRKEKDDAKDNEVRGRSLLEGKEEGHAEGRVLFFSGGSAGSKDL